MRGGGYARRWLRRAAGNYFHPWQQHVRDTMRPIRPLARWLGINHWKFEVWIEAKDGRTIRLTFAQVLNDGGVDRIRAWLTEGKS